MCGPFGHAFITEVDGPADGGSPDGGGTPVKAPDSGGPSDTGAVVEPETPSRWKRLSEAAKKGWRTRRDRLRSKSELLPSGRLLIPGFLALNAHHEIMGELGIIGEDGLTACGFDLPSGKLLIQRRSLDSRALVSSKDEIAAEKVYFETIRGRFTDFFVRHAGRLGDVSEWKAIFHRLLSFDYVLHSLRRSVIDQERYMLLVNHELAIRATQGIVLADRWGRFEGISHSEIEDAVPCLPASARKLGSRLADRLWGKHKETAVQRMTKYPSEFVASVL